MPDNFDISEDYKLFAELTNNLINTMDSKSELYMSEKGISEMYCNIINGLDAHLTRIISKSDKNLFFWEDQLRNILDITEIQANYFVAKNKGLDHLMDNITFNKELNEKPEYYSFYNNRKIALENMLSMGLINK